MERERERERERENYENLKRAYGDHASWAVWSDEAPDDPSIIESSIDELNPGKMLIGLNPSRQLGKSAWSNFHDARPGNNDWWLRKKLGDSNHPWHGASMTDVFISNRFIGTDSVTLRQEVCRNPESLQREINRFHKELKDVAKLAD